MNKSIYLTAAAALALASCSQDDLMDNGMTGDNSNAIAFESYLGKSAQSRATVVTTESLKKEGFTVDAYYTGTDEFSSEATGSVFMKGTKVTYNEGKAAWVYSPLKYWPNNTGDKVSFFAYGPYGNTNIKLNENAVSSIDFTVQNDVRNQVDFIYNNQAANSTINCTKPTVNDKVSFLFKHALSRIGFTVAAAVDETSVGTVKLDGNSRINVKKVALVDATSTVANLVDGPFYKNGTLDMLEGKWSDLDGAQSFTLAGKNHFYRTVTDKDVENSTNDIDVVQLHKFNQSQRLLNDSAYVMIIPTDISENTDAKTSFKIYIEYDVITEDDDNADASKITNKILSENALDVKFEAGKAYNFNLILGMTSVKFDVDKVVDWENADSIDEWLPENESAAPEWDEETSAFFIYNAAQLKYVRDVINKDESVKINGETHRYNEAKYVLKDNIDLEGKAWTPIKGTAYGTNEYGDYTVRTFEGTFDGNGFEIRNLSLNSTENYYGFFSKVCGTLKNIKIVNDAATLVKFSHEYCGVIAGEAEDATIEDCSVNATIELDKAQTIGGLFGFTNGSDDHVITVSRCTFEGSITGTGDTCGGIAGFVNTNSKVIDCVNKGNAQYTYFVPDGLASVENPDIYLGGNGGIAGVVAGMIEHCSNEGDITGYYVGGIVGGRVNGFTESFMGIIACNNSGTITGTKAGGIAYKLEGDHQILKCYNTGLISGTESQGGIAAAIAGDTLMLGCYNIGTFGNNDSAKTAHIAAENVKYDWESDAEIINCYWGKEETGYKGVYFSTDDSGFIISETEDWSTVLDNLNSTDNNEKIAYEGADTYTKYEYKISESYPVLSKK